MTPIACPMCLFVPNIKLMQDTLLVHFLAQFDIALKQDIFASCNNDDFKGADLVQKFRILDIGKIVVRII